MRTTNQNLIVNIVMVKRDVIEDARRYIPQPNFLSSLFRKVINEKIPLIRPMTTIIIVIPAATCIKDDCFPNDVFG